MLTLITWLRKLLSGVSDIKLLFCPLSTLSSLEGSHYGQATLKEQGVRLHLLEGRVRTYVIWNWFHVSLFRILQWLHTTFGMEWKLHCMMKRSFMIWALPVYHLSLPHSRTTPSVLTRTHQPGALVGLCPSFCPASPTLPTPRPSPGLLPKFIESFITISLKKSSVSVYSVS